MNISKELDVLTDEQKAENLKKNLKLFKKGLLVIGNETDLAIPKEVLVVDQSEINDSLAGIVCNVITKCNNRILISKQYLKTGREKDNFLNTAYHEVLHFNDSRMNILVTGKLQWVGVTSARHNEINRLGHKLRDGGDVRTIERKIWESFQTLTE